VDGAPGAPGKDGVDGVDGEDGATGAPGRDGVDDVSPDAPSWMAALAYTNNKQAGVGFEVENLRESGSIWTNIASFSLTITTTFPKTALTKYELGAGSPSQAPRDWSVAFFDELENQVGTDVRSGESFSILAMQEYIVAPPSASVTKAVLTIPVTFDRNSMAIRINETGQLELVAPNTPRYNFDPVTLEPLGLLIEPVETNLVSGDVSSV
jgi:hypothetical protein